MPGVYLAEIRVDLRAKLAVDVGGVVLTTIQMFFSEDRGDRHLLLSERRNIVVIANETHRSQYDFNGGYARHMRDRTAERLFHRFHGNANTRAVFGDYISVCGVQHAVDDKATVPIFYESRPAMLGLEESERPKIDPGFEDATEGKEISRKERLMTILAQFEANIGSDERLDLIAEDIAYYENRLEAMEGKAMPV